MSHSIKGKSNEQYRLQKARSHATGMNHMDALDEKINNATDAGATLIELQFNSKGNGPGTLESTYNNGKPADKNDLEAFITLDGPSKTDDPGTIGEFGIGNFY